MLERILLLGALLLPVSALAQEKPGPGQEEKEVPGRKEAGRFFYHGNLAPLKPEQLAIELRSAHKLINKIYDARRVWFKSSIKSLKKRPTSEEHEKNVDKPYRKRLNELSDKLAVHYKKIAPNVCTYLRRGKFDDKEKNKSVVIAAFMLKQLCYRDSKVWDHLTEKEKDKHTVDAAGYMVTFYTIGYRAEASPELTKTFDGVAGLDVNVYRNLYSDNSRLKKMKKEDWGDYERLQDTPVLLDRLQRLKTKSKLLKSKEFWRSLRYIGKTKGETPEAYDQGGVEDKELDKLLKKLNKR